MKLRLNHYQRKGIAAYLSSVEIEGSTIKRHGFISGSVVDEGNNKERYYQKKLSFVEFDLETFGDGLYMYREANGHKESRGYVRIQAGEVVEEWESVAEMLDAVAPLPQLPTLKGSSKQIAWGNEIRAKAIRTGFSVQEASKIEDAKTWIEIRDELGKGKRAQETDRLGSAREPDWVLAMRDAIACDNYRTLQRALSEYRRAFIECRILFGVKLTSKKTILLAFAKRILSEHHYA